jgi:uncharacterized protein
VNGADCGHRSHLAQGRLAQQASSSQGLPKLIHRVVIGRSMVSYSATIKAIAFFLVWLAVWLPIAIPIALGLKWRPFNPLTVQQKLSLLASLYLLAPLLLWGFSRLDAFPFSDYGLHWQLSSLRSLGLGLGMSLIGLLLVFGLELKLGWVEWQRDRQAQLVAALAPTLALALWVGVTEELIFRGFLLNQFGQDFSPWVAAIASSVIFAILHMVWEGLETVPQLPGLWLMGMVLVLARWVDHGSLGLAWGLHAGWVWGIASLDTAQILTYTRNVPEWVTGIGNRPVAGLAGIVLLLGTGFALLPWFMSLPLMSP